MPETVKMTKSAHKRSRERLRPEVRSFIIHFAINVMLALCMSWLSAVSFFYGYEYIGGWNVPVGIFLLIVAGWMMYFPFRFDKQ